MAVTTVDIDNDLIKRFKITNLQHADGGINIKLFVNRCMHLFLEDDNFRNLIISNATGSLV